MGSAGLKKSSWKKSKICIEKCRETTGLFCEYKKYVNVWKTEPNC